MERGLSSPRSDGTVEFRRIIMTMQRRTFLKSAAGGLCLLASLSARRAQAAELKYDPKRMFPLSSSDGIPPDELRILAGYIEAFSLPAGTMAPSGGWTAVYDILKVELESKRNKGAKKEIMSNAVMGQVAITRPAGSSDYRIEMLYQPTGAFEKVEAHLVCAADPLASIRRYEATWSCSSPKPKISYSRQEAGAVESGALEVVAGNAADRFEINHPLTCLWTLMDAVRFLPPKSGWKQEFDLYADLSALRRNQVLSYSGTGQVKLASGPLKVNFYQQTGAGSPPIHYAVDEQQRTLFVTQGQQAWGLNRIERA
jgi:hypothetical protein